RTPSMPPSLSATLRPAPGPVGPGPADLAAPDNPPGAGGMAHTMLTGLLWTFLGTGARGLGQLLVLIVLAHLLTVRDFGIVNAALVVLGVAVTVSQYAVAPAMVQIPDLRMAHIRVAFTLSLLLGVALLVLQPHPMIPLLEGRALRELARFGGGMMLAKLANYAAGQGDSAVVVRSLGAEALGLYGRAIQLMVMPAMYIGDVLDRVLFPG